MTYPAGYDIINTVKGGTPRRIRGKCRKEKNMDDMNVGEMLREVVEENQTRKILEIVEKCETLDEAKEKIRALLNK